MLPVSLSQLELICQRLRQAGQLAKQLATQQFEVHQKGPGDFVTTVDQELDRLLTAQFQAWFPQDGLITEENASSTQAFSQSYPRLWLIDPLDGTDDLIQGRTGYAVMVGLLAHLQPLAGWIYSPQTDTLYCGGPSWGIFQAHGAEPLQVLQPYTSAETDLKSCPLLLGSKDYGHYATAIAQASPELEVLSSLGSFGLKIMEVICGRAGLYLYLNGRVKLWDTVGPIALAKAAGLACCDLQGQPLQFDAASVMPTTLTHRQSILVGWPHAVERFRSQLVQAIATVKP
jgi:3'(2'), 5'-bisphosphate nucleotidase